MIKLSPGTTQENGVVEQLFATIHSWIQLMMLHAVLYEKLTTGIWPEFMTITIKLDNSIFNPHKEKCAYEKLYKNMNNYAKYFNNFG